HLKGIHQQLFGRAQLIYVAYTFFVRNDYPAFSEIIINRIKISRLTQHNAYAIGYRLRICLQPTSAQLIRQPHRKSGMIFIYFYPMVTGNLINEALCLTIWKKEI